MYQFGVQYSSKDWHYPSLPLDMASPNEPASPDQDPQADVVEAEPELKQPPMYAVVMYNDNYTPMEFVVLVLQSEFKLQLEAAVEVMLNIHHNGKGIAGVFPKDIAESKAKKVNVLAQKEGYPLLTQIEPHHGNAD